MPTIYTSKYSGAEIDMAIMNALMFNPDENGWIKLASSVSTPVELDELISTGNFVVDYFLHGPEELNDCRPINVSVHDEDGIFKQYITYLDTVYYRDYDYDSGLYSEEWTVKKTTNYIYIDEVPSSPEMHSLAIIKDENENYTLHIYDGAWVPVATPDVMLGKVYDTTGRNVDFFQYADELYQQMTSSSIGLSWTEEDVTNLFGKEVSCFKYTADISDTYLITFKDSSKMVYADSYTMFEVDMPLTMRNPQIIAFKDDSGMLSDIYVYDTNVYSSFIYKTDGTFAVWDTIDLSTTEIWNDYTSDDAMVVPSRFYGSQSGVINNALCSDDAYPWCYMKFEHDGTIFYGILRFKSGIGPRSIYEISALEDWQLANVDAYFDSIMCIPRGNVVYINSSLSDPSAGIDFDIALGVSSDVFLYSIDGGSVILTKVYTKQVWEVRDDGSWYLKPYLRAEFRDLTGDTFNIRETINVLTESNHYVKYSNFKEFFDMYTGYAISNTGRVDCLSFILDIEAGTVEFTATPIYQIPDMYFKPDAILFDTSFLKIIGHSNNTDVTYKILTSSQEDNILEAVEEHISNVNIHFSDADREVLRTRETRENVEVKFNQVQADSMKIIDTTMAEAIDLAKSINDELNNAVQVLTDHIADNEKHIDADRAAKWDAKAEPNHTHNLDGRVKIHARDIVTGKININRIPNGAKERITKVETLDDMLNLTSTDVQLGDRVAIKHTATEGAFELYEVVDESLLATIDPDTGEITPGTAEAFHECAAGSGVWIDWKNVESKPTTVAGYGIEDTYTMTETEEVIDEKIELATAKLEERYAEYDLEELYELIHHTDEEITIIEQEMTAAVEISEQVTIQDQKLNEQFKRISQMAEDMDEVEEIVADLLAKYS